MDRLGRRRLLNATGFIATLLPAGGDGSCREPPSIRRGHGQGDVKAISTCACHKVRDTRKLRRLINDEYGLTVFAPKLVLIGIDPIRIPSDLERSTYPDLHSADFAMGDRQASDR
jgi:hypothetical protein